MVSFFNSPSNISLEDYSDIEYKFMESCCSRKPWDLASTHVQKMASSSPSSTLQASLKQVASMLLWTALEGTPAITLAPYNWIHMRSRMLNGVILWEGFGCRYLLGKTINVVLYVDRLDGPREDKVDVKISRAISQAFGPQIWPHVIVVFTHAEIHLEDVTYSEFVSRRSAALRNIILKESRFKTVNTKVSE